MVREFKKLIGNNDFLGDKYNVSEEQYQRVKAMAGNHGHAYCKMLLANLP